MSVSIEVVNPTRYAGCVADEIIACAQDAISAKGEFCLALSGGRTPGAVYRALTNSGRADQIEWDKVKLFIGDERWVPQDDPSSNVRMVRETLLADIPFDEKKLFYIDTTLPAIDQAVENYTESLKKELPDESGVPVLDLVLLGLGTNGHFASIFPGSDEVSDLESLVVKSVNPEDSSQRVTLAPKLIMNAKKILFIVRGEGKQKILKTVFDSKVTEKEVPALLLTRNVSDRITWYLDSASAKNLPPAILNL